MLDLLIRVVVAIVFALISTAFLVLSFLVLKKTHNLKYDGIAAGVLAGAYFIFSFFPNYALSIVAALIGLVAIKGLYIRSWKESLKVWGVWMLFWIVLFLVIAGVIALVQPFSSVV